MVKPMEETDTNKSCTLLFRIHLSNPEITVEEDEHFTDFENSSSEYLPSSLENAANSDQSSSDIEILTCEILPHEELLRNEELLQKRRDRKGRTKTKFSEQTFRSKKT
ncbi:hypothetical protein JTB14_017027 [Gonioctena quinquepunctata]|nr:hypothetical protein JTB14_017027 [Gonioctena quinquepunctata]